VIAAAADGGVTVVSAAPCRVSQCWRLGFTHLHFTTSLQPVSRHVKPRPREDTQSSRPRKKLVLSGIVSQILILDKQMFAE